MVKPKIRMTTKELSYKQVIVSINNRSGEVIMKQANFYINNINRCLKDANLKTLAGFVHL